MRINTIRSHAAHRMFQNVEVGVEKAYDKKYFTVAVGYYFGIKKSIICFV